MRKTRNKRKRGEPKQAKRKQIKNIKQEIEPIVLWDLAMDDMIYSDCPNPWRDINEYVDFLCDAVSTFFWDSFYYAAPEEICLYIEKDNIWSVKVARPEAKSELDYYKCIEFTKIGKYQYDVVNKEEYFAADRELVRQFVEEQFDSAYFD